MIQVSPQCPDFLRRDVLSRQVVRNRLRSMGTKLFIKVLQGGPQNLQLLLSQLFLLSDGFLCDLRASVVQSVLGMII